MASKRIISTRQSHVPFQPATTPEEREDQLISRAIDLAEQQLIDGTASSQVITHFLKLASSKERIEKEILEKQKDLLTAKTEALQSQKRIEELYAEALESMREYKGETDDSTDIHGPFGDDYV